MPVQIELWQLMGGIAAVILAFATMIWAFGKILMSQFEKRLGERFAAIEEARRSAGESLQGELAQLRTVERDFMKFQAELPTRFVMRDDYIRGQSILEAKQDALFNKMEVVRLEIAQVKGVQT
ncbi:MAG TPA: hypothetical protein VFQ99_05725 [Gallionella sp.]|nr:hypothetical protein [Gallionella sp.]